MGEVAAMRWDDRRTPGRVSLLFLILALFTLAAISLLPPRRGGEPGLLVEGVVVDAETGRPVEADVYLDGRLIYEQVTSFSVQVKAGSELRVEAEGYHPWALRFRYKLKETRIFRGPVRLKPKEGR